MATVSIHIEYETSVESLAEVLASMTRGINRKTPEPRVTLSSEELEALAPEDVPEPDLTPGSITYVPDAEPEAPAPVAEAPAPAPVAIPSMFDPIWDERIHSGAKSKNNDGSWKKKRGVSKTTFDTITAELAAGGAPVAEAPAPTPTPAPAPAPTPAPAPAPVAPASTISWPDIIKAVTNGMHMKFITQEQVNAALTKVGASAFAYLAPMTDKHSEFMTELGLPQ